jgi:outer membrane biosynthesis protein TonB
MNNILKKIKNQVVVVVKLIITLNGHVLEIKVLMPNPASALSDKFF